MPCRWTLFKERIIINHKDVKTLADLAEGQLGEIVRIENDAVFRQYGANVGMSVLILQKAV